MKTLLFVIGLSGSGKTTVGKFLAERYGFKFYDLDEFVVPELKKVLEAYGRTFTPEERRAITEKSFEIIDQLIEESDRVVVSFLMRREDMREMYLARYNNDPLAKIVLVKAPKPVCIERVRGRTDHMLPQDTVIDAMAIFEPLEVSFLTLENSGSFEDLIRNIEDMLNMLGI